MSRLLDLLLRHGFVVILAGFFLFFALSAKSFLTAGNLVDLLEGNAVLLILALAMTLIVAAGGIDLSVGVALDFGAAFAMVALKTYGVPWPLAVGIAVAGAALVGLVNAGLIVGLGVSPFLATLGVLFIGSSIERIYTDGGGPIAFRARPKAIATSRSATSSASRPRSSSPAPSSSPTTCCSSARSTASGCTRSACSAGRPRSPASGSAATCSGPSSPPRPPARSAG